MNRQTQHPDFGGLTVVSFESRRANEMATLISNYGGKPLVAPTMREIPLRENPAAFAFAAELFASRLDTVIFLTGVGTETLIKVLETRYPRESLARALSAVRVVARGPKPLKVLRELRVSVTITVPEPNTWRDVLRVFDQNAQGFALDGSRVAVQEYGVSNQAFLDELRRRGARVLEVPVYRWGLPEDLVPLRSVVEALVEDRAQVVLFTNAVQVDHLLRFASGCGAGERLLGALRRCAVCSVGPICTEALAAAGLAADLEPKQGRMGLLVREAAKQARDLLRQKANRPGISPTA